MTDKKWVVLRSTYALKTPWFSVRLDDCLTGAGVEVAPYYTLELPDFVHVLAEYKGQVILVEQYRHALGAMSLELPGGLLGKNEFDIIAAGARELKEETGYAGGSWKYVMSLCVDPARYENQLHFLRAKDVLPGTATPDPAEDIKTILVSRREAVDLATSGAIKNANHAAIILMGLL